jgi:2-isopropylmalate synthase
MCIVTMGMNLYSRGVDPELDFSNIDEIIQVVKRVTNLPVHPRHPYAGELVFTAFSGSHQDAIKKSLALQGDDEPWDVAYLPIDPEDLGRDYQSVIRVNSQSGKGGVAYIMDREFGFKLPKAMHPEFGAIIQRVTDETGDELTPQQVLEVFEQEYLERVYPYKLRECHIHMDTDEQSVSDTIVQATVGMNGETIAFEGKGNGPIDAFVKGLNQHSDLRFTLETYDEHDIDHRSDSRAVAYISIKTTSGRRTFGVGLDSNISVASIRAILSALNRLSA